MYLTLKYAHVGFVLSSLLLFTARAVLAVRGHPLLGNPALRVLPHIVDTLLLASAIALAVLSRQYPLVEPWLTAKVLALALYIVLGSLAIKRAPTAASKALYAVLAVATFGYIVLVALTKQPLPLYY